MASAATLSDNRMASAATLSDHFTFSGVHLSLDLNLKKPKLKRFLVRNVMTDLSTILLDLVQNTYSVRFSYLLRLNHFCKGPQNMQKIPQKC